MINLFLLITTIDGFAQNKIYSFSLNGTITQDTGTVTLALAGDTSYYPKNLRQLTAKIVKGKFSLNGKITQPFAFEISVNDRQFVTNTFVIDTGVQVIEIDTSLNKATPKVGNKIMEQDYPKYVEAFEKLRLKYIVSDAKRDSLAAIYGRKLPQNILTELDLELKQSYKDHDSTLLEYVQNNPSSYYSLWTFVRLTTFGYDEKFEDIYTAFSDSLKNSYVGEKLKKYLDNSNYKALTAKVKQLQLLDSNQNKMVSINYLANKFTMLDFWYSNCSPCIAQFPHLTSIYAKFKPLGLEIIGISTDKVERKQAWLNMIEKYSLNWSQFLDASGIETYKLGVRAFPSNILLNNEGKVIAFNLLPSELDSYMKKHLKD